MSAGFSPASSVWHIYSPRRRLVRHLGLDDNSSGGEVSNPFFVQNAYHSPLTCQSLQSIGFVGECPNKAKLGLLARPDLW